MPSSVLGRDRVLLIEGDRQAVRLAIALQSLWIGSDLGSGMVSQVAVLFQRFVDNSFEFTRHFRIESQWSVLVSAWRIGYEHCCWSGATEG